MSLLVLGTFANMLTRWPFGGVLGGRLSSHWLLLWLDIYSFFLSFKINILVLDIFKRQKKFYSNVTDDFISLSKKTFSVSF